MNRPIKLRFWDKTNQRLIVCGDDLATEIFLHFGGTRAIRCYDGTSEKTMVWDAEFSEKYVAQQFTGFTDKDKHNIFEGDIIQDIKKEDVPHAVVWGESFGGWLLTDKLRKNPDRIQWDNELYLWNKDSRIIGNVFENPELLEK